MPQSQPISAAITTAEDRAARRSAARSMPTTRQLREQRFRQLVALQQTLSRLMVEYTLHDPGSDNADSVAARLVDTEDQLQRCFPVQWSRVQSQLLLEEVELWAEQHTEDAPCAGCKILNYLSDESVTDPVAYRMRE